MRVLLIEDDAITRALLVDELLEHGMDVDALANAEDALILFGAGQVPNVLVTDINLGAGLHGVDLADMARAKHPDLQVVFMSAERRDPAGRPLLPHETFVRKPFPPQRLVAAIRRVGADPA